jgi:hypothetical protein
MPCRLSGQAAVAGPFHFDQISVPNKFILTVVGRTKLADPKNDSPQSVSPWVVNERGKCIGSVSVRQLSFRCYIILQNSKKVNIQIRRLHSRRILDNFSYFLFL